MSAYPLIDGNKFDFSSVEWNYNGYIVTAVNEISYSQALTPGQVYGARSEVLAFTRGTLAAGEGSFSMPIQDASEFMTELGSGYREILLPCTVTYGSPNVATITDKLVACRITNDENSGSAGSEEPLMTVFSFMYLYGSRNGIFPLLNQLT